MRTRVRKQLTGACVCVAAALLWTTPAMGATITPNTFGDENGGGGSCSLREAIQAANTNAGFGGCAAGSGADTIPLAPAPTSSQSRQTAPPTTISTATSTSSPAAR
jgi:CSLREA domain-containing protein